MNKETSLIKKALLAMSEAGYTMFRNNVGLGWVGDVVQRYARDGNKYMVIKNPRPLHAGLIKGSSDLIGWRSVRIMPEMVGSTVAVFVGAEVKTKGVRETKDQKTFREALVSAGGYGLVVRKAEDIREDVGGGVAVPPDITGNIDAPAGRR